jgi:hypothetical protein
MDAFLLLAWSRDRRSLAVSPTAWPAIRLTTWHDGERLRSYWKLPPFRSFDSLAEILWSPDARRLLLRGYESMGAADMGHGDLWCFRLRDSRSHRVSDRPVLRAAWVSARRIRYVMWTGELRRVPSKNHVEAVEAVHEQACP